MQLVKRLDDYYGSTETAQSIINQIFEYKLGITEHCYNIEIDGNCTHFACAKCNKILLKRSVDRHIKSKHHNRVFKVKEVIKIENFVSMNCRSEDITTFLNKVIFWIIYSKKVKSVEDWQRGGGTIVQLRDFLTYMDQMGP